MAPVLLLGHTSLALAKLYGRLSERYMEALNARPYDWFNGIFWWLACVLVHALATPLAQWYRWLFNFNVRRHWLVEDK